MTSPQPFLQVDIGEVIGFIEAPPESEGLTQFKENLTEEIRQEFKSGFLHWEILTTEKEKTVPHQRGEFRTIDL